MAKEPDESTEGDQHEHLGHHRQQYHDIIDLMDGRRYCLTCDQVV